jgi:hypothetical protein
VIAVIQCAARKRKDAGYLKNGHNVPVMIVADPARAPSRDGLAYARPDDLSDTGVSWRDAIVQYNSAPGNNPLSLLPACQLYENPAYLRLAEHQGTDRMYILSAGWGLIRADFLTPQYDVTFSAAVRKESPYKYRRKQDVYADFRHMPSGIDEPVIFFGGKDYIPLFCRLTQGIKGSRTVYYNSSLRPEAPGCELAEFATSTRTNWHYECVSAYLQGKLSVARWSR